MFFGVRDETLHGKSLANGCEGSKSNSWVEKFHCCLWFVFKIVKKSQISLEVFNREPKMLRTLDLALKMSQIDAVCIINLLPEILFWIVKYII